MATFGLTALTRCVKSSALKHSARAYLATHNAQSKFGSQVSTRRLSQYPSPHFTHITTTTRSLHSTTPSCKPGSEAPTEETPTGLIVSDRAAERLKLINKNKPTPQFLRVMVDSGGCSGFAYDFSLVDQDTIEEDDRIFKNGDSSVVIDEVSLELMEGSTIDYTMELIKRAFVVANNPNAEAGCGCGISFSLK
eukprot:m.205172 g.205172  ORF g.205172 m.205172 type:complete len:193 (+) comp32906_c6_seq3:414-992(+)